MAQVAIAYAREDVAVAQALKAELERRGLTVFLDVGATIRGEWRPAIDAEIAAAADLVVLVSGHVATSAEVPREVGIALARGSNLVPVLLVDEPPSAPEWLARLLDRQAVRFDRLDLVVSASRIQTQLVSRPSPLRVHGQRFWIGLAAVLSLGFVAALLLPRPTPPVPAEPAVADVQPPLPGPAASPVATPPRRSGNIILRDGNVAYEHSGFSFSRQQVVAWDAGHADLQAARPEGEPLTALFLPYDTTNYKDPRLDRNARAGLREMAAGSVSEVTSCPPDGYVHHWVRPRPGTVYCVRWRDGAGQAVIRIDTVDNDRIGFDYLLPAAPPGR